MISLSNYSFWYLCLLSLTIMFVARCFNKSFLKLAWYSTELSALKSLKIPFLSSLADLYYEKISAAPSIPSAISATWEAKGLSVSSCLSPACLWVSANFLSHSWIWFMNYLRVSLESESIGPSIKSIQLFWSLTNYSPAAISTLNLPHCSAWSTLGSSPAYLAACASLSTSACSSWLVLITFKSLSLIF